MTNKIGLLLLVVLCLLFPVLFNNNYLLHIMVISGIQIILVLSLNVITGITGQVSLGHAAFFGIGAYASALLSINGVPVWISMMIAILIAAISGLIIGYPVLRLKGHFFAIASMGFGSIVHLIIENWIEVTKGPMGLGGIPKPESFFGIDFGSRTSYYYFTFAMVILTVYLSRRIKHSKMGRAMLAIRTDEITAKTLGVDVTYYKVVSFTWSAAIAGLAGVLYAHFILFISPETFSTTTSVNILLMLLVGGMGSIGGSVFGGLFVTVFTENLRSFVQYQMLIYGIAIIVIVIFAPRGFSGLIATVMKRISAGKKRTSSEFVFVSEE